MQSPEARAAATPTRTQLHLALAGFADEVVGTLAHLLAYVGVLALFAILSLAALDRLPDPGGDGPGRQTSSALNQLDSLEKTSDQRAAIACPPDRPAQLNPDNTQAEPNRRSCDPSGPDWLLGAANAQLRGTL